MIETTKHGAMMSDQDFALHGIEQIAYVKPITLEDGKTAYAVHAADGQQAAVLADREVAFAAVKQNNLEPVSVH